MEEKKRRRSKRRQQRAIAKLVRSLNEWKPVTSPLIDDVRKHQCDHRNFARTKIDKNSGNENHISKASSLPQLRLVAKIPCQSRYIRRDYNHRSRSNYLWKHHTRRKPRKSPINAGEGYLKSHENVLENAKIKLRYDLDRCKNKSKKIVEVFRSCGPDEFGFVNKEKFCKGFGKHFQLSRFDAETIFDSLNRREDREISFKRIQKLFQEGKSQAPVFEETCPYQVQYQNLIDLDNVDQETRDTYKFHQQLYALLNRKRSWFKRNFYSRELDPMTKEERIRAKLNISEINAKLHEAEFTTNFDFKSYLTEKVKVKNLTLSQLERLNQQYLDNDQELVLDPKPVDTTTCRGIYLGCRRRKIVENSCISQSTRQKHLKTSPIIPNSLIKDDLQDRHRERRWQTKLLEPSTNISKRCRQKRTTVFSYKMSSGHGDLLSWYGN